MKQTERFNAEQLLEAVPVANQAVKAEPLSDDRIMLVVPLRKRWFNSPPFSWLLAFSKERRIELDVLGTEVWLMADGRSTTEQIIEQFAAHHQLSFHEARVCVTQFLRMMTERQLIAMVGRSGDGV